MQLVVWECKESLFLAKLKQAAALGNTRKSASTTAMERGVKRKHPALQLRRGTNAGEPPRKRRRDFVQRDAAISSTSSPADDFIESDHPLVVKCSVEATEGIVSIVKETFQTVREVTDRFVDEAQKFSNFLMQVVTVLIEDDCWCIASNVLDCFY